MEGPAEDLLPPTPTLPRSPPRPSPGSLHYSDEDVTKYNDLIPAESSSLTEKPSEISDSQVRGRRAWRPLTVGVVCEAPHPGLWACPPLPALLALWAGKTEGPQEIPLTAH